MNFRDPQNPRNSENANFPNHKHYNSVLQEKDRQEGRLEGFTVYELAYRPDHTQR